MNGFNLLKNNDLQSYLSVLAKAEAYSEEDCVCIDIENESADITLMFMKSMSLPKRNEIEVMIKELIELDEFVACRDRSREYYAETGYEFELSYAEFESLSELTMYYCGVNINTQWGAEFSKNEVGTWVFGGLC